MPRRDPITPSPSIIAKFEDTPWAHAMFSDANLIPFLNEAPVKKHPGHTGGILMSTTLNGEDTISAWQSFYRDPLRSGEGNVEGEGIGGEGGHGEKGGEKGKREGERAQGKSAGKSESNRLEAISVMKLGKGVNAHADVCHGGFVGVLLDEVIGLAVDCEIPAGNSQMTASLKVDYKRPVATPSTVLCRSWVERKEGRKVWGRGTVEDGRGTILAIGEALFIRLEGGRVGRGFRL